MTLSKAITRRIMEGDIQVIQENGKHYIAYNNFSAQIVGGRIELALCLDDIVVSSFDAAWEPGTTTHLEGIEGRVELRLE